MTPAFQNSINVNDDTKKSIKVNKSQFEKGANCRTFSQRSADIVASAFQNSINVKKSICQILGGIGTYMRERRERSYILYILTIIIFFYYYILSLSSNSEKEREFRLSINVSGLTFIDFYGILTKRTQADGGGVKT
jgi:hypothetical protein